MRRHLSLLALLCLIAGCSPAVRMDRRTFAGFEAYRITNQKVELTVVPDIGRIIAFGPHGGENLFWQDPAAPGHPLFGWINWGGDKIWLWPQDDWKARAGKSWPPPTEAVGPHEFHFDGQMATMRSPVIPAYGVRIVREIRLTPGLREVHLITRLEPEPGHTPPPVVPWQVTQIPRVPRLIASNVDQPVKAHALGPAAKWPTTRPDGNWLWLIMNDDTDGKIGLDAERFSVTLGRYQFDTESLSGGAYAPGERAQLHIDRKGAPGRPIGAEPYIELEFTAPRQTHRPGELHVVWRLVRHP